MLIHTWSIIYPYYASFLHAQNSHITASLVFSGLFVYYLGNILGNSINPFTIQVIGYKNNLYFGSLLMLWLTYILTSKFTLFWMFTGRLLLGVIKAIVWDSNNLFLSEKYS